MRQLRKHPTNNEVEALRLKVKELEHRHGKALDRIAEAEREIRQLEASIDCRPVPYGTLPPPNLREGVHLHLTYVSRRRSSAFSFDTIEFGLPLELYDRQDVDRARRMLMERLEDTVHNLLEHVRASQNRVNRPMTNGYGQQTTLRPDYGMIPPETTEAAMRSIMEASMTVIGMDRALAPDRTAIARILPPNTTVELPDDSLPADFGDVNA